jgi:hypothetical protein
MAAMTAAPTSTTAPINQRTRLRLSAPPDAGGGGGGAVVGGISGGTVLIAAP